MSNMKKSVVSAVLWESSKPTISGRIYPIEVIKKMVKEMRESIKNRRMICQMETPTRTGCVSIAEASHLITSLKIDNGNRLIAEIEILNTEKGKKLQEMLKNKQSISFHLNGVGSTTKNDDGIDVVGDDYQIFNISCCLDKRPLDPS